MHTIFDQRTKVPFGLEALLDRSTVALTIADAMRRDYPLVAANEPFFRLTGYDEDEVVGKNCRFLQPFGGAGPVNKRIRRFLQTDEKEDAKFVVPNLRRDGSPFINLLYLAKLRRKGTVSLILGSQFSISAQADVEADLYDRALRDDLRQLNLLTNETNWVFLGSFDALASSNAIIARMRME